MVTRTRDGEWVTLDVAGKLMKQLPISEWGGWMVGYLLEWLDGQIDAVHYELLLERLRQDITDRLEAGTW